MEFLLARSIERLRPSSITPTVLSQRAACFTCLIGVLFCSNAHANTLTATIDALQIHPESNGGYVRLTGSPNFDGGGCSGVWAKGSLDDDKFMIYIWPALMSAKARGVSVTINVTGCAGPHAQITWIQINAT